jgi:glycosyltransferase involved in cell wall biosynthesis
VKIAYVITRGDAVGGATIHVRDMARAMIEDGHEAVVLVGGSGAVTEQLARSGVPYHSLKLLQRSIHPVRDWRALAELTAVLRSLAPDLVSTHTAKAGWIGRAACARLGLPAVHTPHGWAIGRRISTASGVLFTLAERVAKPWARAIICVCEHEKRLAMAKGVAHPEDLFVVHNGVRDIPPALRAEPGRTPVRICSVARLEAPKDHATLLAALRTVDSAAWTLDLVGDGPNASAIRERARALGIGDRVHLLGYQPDTAVPLAEAQIFALSSRSEAFPRSVLEAMRAGLPIVASDVGGVREAVTHGSNGFLVPPGDPAAMGSALSALLRDAGLRRTLGAASRDAYERQFRVEFMVRKTQAVYADVLRRAGSSPAAVTGAVRSL